VTIWKLRKLKYKFLSNETNKLALDTVEDPSCSKNNLGQTLTVKIHLQSILCLK